MKLNYVYLPRSYRDEKCCLGWTLDLERRMCEHNEYKRKEDAQFRQHNTPHALQQLKKKLKVTQALASSCVGEVVG